MKVIACEPYPDRAFCEKWGVELVSMDELLDAPETRAIMAVRFNLLENLI